MHIADLHIHSKYSYATSRDCDAPHLDLWARRKGITLLGAGDCTHAGWRKELQEMLCPDGNGLYTLRAAFALPDAPQGEKPRFIISGEISSIYRKGGKVRRVHNTVLLPGLDDAERISARLEGYGNLHADGRPTLRLDCRDLTELILDACPRALVIPAHIWTPHFSVLGAFSDFGSIAECFGDMTPHIHALETGLSSDPAMNGRLSILDRFAMVSSSDAHSPAKLGREASLFAIDLSYDALARALCGQDPAGFCGTLEFFPEEGKYHHDGHRSCGVCLSPQETRDLGGRCPLCGGKLTIGVMHRLEALADRPPEQTRHRPFECLTPLPELLAACMDAPAAGVRVQREYLRLLYALGPELFILRKASLADVRLAAGEKTAEGLRRLRQGEVIRHPGFDGQYGKIFVFPPGGAAAEEEQMSLFPAVQTAASPSAVCLDAQQQSAVQTKARITAVLGSAGTGKTAVFAARIAHMIGTLGIRPAHIFAVTQTSDDAAALKTELARLLGGTRAVSRLHAGTLLSLVRARQAAAQSGTLLAPDMRYALAYQLKRETGFAGTPADFLLAVHKLKHDADEHRAGLTHAEKALYDWKLYTENAMDADDLLLDELKAGLAPAKARAKPLHVLIDGLPAENDMILRLARAWSARGTLFVTADPCLCAKGEIALPGFAEADAVCTITLRQNYRHTREILRCAQAAAQGAKSVPQTICRDEAEHKVRLVHARSARDEAHAAARDIAAQAGGIRPHKAGVFGQTAVLYPSYRGLPLLARTFDRAGIPFIISRPGDALHSPRVHGVLSLMRFLRDPQDNLSLRAYLGAVWRLSARRMDHFIRLLAAAPADSTLQQRLTCAESAAEDTAMRHAAHEAAAFAGLYPRTKPSAFLSQWAEHRGWTKDPDLSYFIAFSAPFRRVDALLDALLLDDGGSIPPVVKKDAVTLSTVQDARHAAFSAVYLCGLTRDCLPGCDDQNGRTLLYQGITRAQHKLTLLSYGAASPLLQNLPAACIHEEYTGGARHADGGIQLSLFPRGEPQG